MVCLIHIFLLSPLSYKDKWTLNWRSICTIPLTLVFSCKRWKHSRPPVRVILAWKNRDEKIEASSEEGRRETQSVRDCSGSLNNFKIRVSNKADHSQIMGIYYLMTNSRQRKWCIGSTTVFDFFSMLYKNQDEESRCHACVKSLLSLSVSELVLWSFTIPGTSNTTVSWEGNQSGLK